MDGQNPTKVTEYDGIEVSESSDLTTVWGMKIAPGIEKTDDPDRQSELAEDFVRLMVEVESSEGILMTKDKWKNRLSDSLGVNKSQINEIYSHVEQELGTDDEADDDINRVPVDEFLREHVDELVVLRSTDSHEDARYQWHFDTGDVIETKKEWKQEHLMKEVLFDRAGVFAADARVDQYGKWVKSWVMVNKTEQVDTGPRTAAAEELKSRIEMQPALSDEVKALQQDVAFIESADADVVEVTNTVIKRICDNAAIEPRALSAELKSMGVRRGGVRRTSYDDVANATWWRIDADWATPSEVIDPGDEADDSDDALIGGDGE
ncbi:MULTISPECIES: hypothetical protein [Halorussus]|uniref:hypothetical protein n=1 Tax=Halorussus TaxID=1070314 RepID=UPI0020A22E38|nr:hypothetical protein [Halorussus vallis]USZ74032.1 hypothetical protein NGM07_11250 [Halorussus vallis]